MKKMILSLVIFLVMFTSGFSIENPNSKTKEVIDPMQVEFVLEDEQPVDDLSFITFDRNFKLEDEAYIDDIPFNTLHIAMHNVEFGKNLGYDVEIEIIEEEIDVIKFNISDLDLQNMFFEISINLLEKIVRTIY